MDILIAVVFVINGVFTFRYQRMTLSICRELERQDIAVCQIALTPTWVGVLAWVHTGLLIGLPIAAFLLYGWIHAAVLLLFGLVGLGLIPSPPYSFYFWLIQRHLDSDIASLRPRAGRQRSFEETWEAASQLQDLEYLKGEIERLRRKYHL